MYACIAHKASRSTFSETSPTPAARRLRGPRRGCQRSLRCRSVPPGWRRRQNVGAEPVCRWLALGQTLDRRRPRWRPRPQTPPDSPGIRRGLASPNEGAPQRPLRHGGPSPPAARADRATRSRGPRLENKSSRSPLLNISILRLTSSTFSCDIAYAVPGRRVLLSMQSRRRLTVSERQRCPIRCPFALRGDSVRASKREKPRVCRASLRHRYRDSNPGFRTENPAS
jgi:hypothetical protein